HSHSEGQSRLHAEFARGGEKRRACGSADAARRDQPESERGVNRSSPHRGSRLAPIRLSTGLLRRPIRRTWPARPSESLRLCGYFLCAFLALCVSAAAAQSARPIQWPAEAPPRPLAAREIKFPQYELQTLPNGLQVVAVLHHEQPAVSMRLLIRAGTAHDPKGKLGLAHLAASLLDQGIGGATPKTAAEMNDAIDFIGGEMGAGAGTDWTMLNVTVMKDSFDTGLRMLSEMARHPALAPNELERQRRQM